MCVVADESHIAPLSPPIPHLVLVCAVCRVVVCPFLHRAVLVLCTLFCIFQHRHERQLIERAVEGHTPVVEQRPARDEPHIKATSPCHERMQLLAVGECVSGHNGIVLSDSPHVIAPRTQHHSLAVEQCRAIYSTVIIVIVRITVITMILRCITIGYTKLTTKFITPTPIIWWLAFKYVSFWPSSKSITSSELIHAGRLIPSFFASSSARS